MPRSIPFALVITSLLLSSGATAADKFPKNCTFPFATIAVHHPIDKTCGLEGEPEDADHAAEYRVKNDLCKTSEPLDVPFWAFEALQTKSDKIAHAKGWKQGNRDVAWPDRSVLSDLVDVQGEQVGEGTVVRLVGFVHGYKLQGRSKPGEGVNCHAYGKTSGDSNDVHIELGATKSDPQCQGNGIVVAEMIPHYRPDAWDVDTLKDVKDEAYPVRVTGPLFLDSRHIPSTCDDARKGQPWRTSVWEIHPVYKFDVCTNTSKKDCPADDDSVWQPLNQWEPSES